MQGDTGDLSLSSVEKRRLKQELETFLVDYERERLQVVSDVVKGENTGNWLQRSWRPLVMLSFAVVILAGTFLDLPLLSEGSGICWKSGWVAISWDVSGCGNE